MEEGNTLSKSISFLENVKANLKRTYAEYIENFNQEDSFEPTKYITDVEFKKARIIIRQLAVERKEEVPKEFIHSRTVEEFINDLTFDNNAEHYQIESYLTSIFNKYCDYLEDNMFEVEIVKLDCILPEELNYNSILVDLENCDKRILEGGL